MTITALDTLLSVLHDRGVLDEDAFSRVCCELFDDQPLTIDHLVQIFGVSPVYHLLTIPDETARTLVREAADLLTNPESTVDARAWLTAAEHVVGPIAFPVKPGSTSSSVSDDPS